MAEDEEMLGKGLNSYRDCLTTEHPRGAVEDQWLTALRRVLMVAVWEGRFVGVQPFPQITRLYLLLPCF